MVPSNSSQQPAASSWGPVRESYEASGKLSSAECDFIPASRNTHTHPHTRTHAHAHTHTHTHTHTHMLHAVAN
jgi:hypothetical protein